ncbi:MAG TPA: GxxExxY protein [Flavitalea sp.]|nr:GxxExxY protein [Flavitalea sp.]
MEKPENQISDFVIQNSISIHKELGPGLYESVYERILFNELQSSGFKIERQKKIPIRFQSVEFEVAFKADLIIEDKVIVEIKSVESVLPVHKMQLKTYLKLTGLKLGLLINFNVDLLKNGITRVANGL